MLSPEDVIASIDIKDYKDVLESKGVLELYNGFKDHTRQTRFMMGYADYAEVDYGGEESATLKDPGMNFKKKGRQDFERVFLFLFTAKSFVDEHSGDLRLVKRRRLGAWMEFDTLFIFTYDGVGDKSEYIDKISVKDAFLIEPLPPGSGTKEMKYAFRVETPFKTYTICVALGIEVTNWIRILKRAKKTSEEVLRTDEAKLRKNIDKLISLYRQKNMSDVMAFCDEEFSLFTLPIRYDRTRPQVVIKTLDNAQLNFFDVVCSD